MSSGQLRRQTSKDYISEESCAECSVSGEVAPRQDVLCPRCREMFKLLEKAKAVVNGAGALSLLETEETRINNLGKQNRLMSRKINVPTAILAPYRLLILFRIIVLGLYHAWRIKNRNEDAMCLWGISVVCEIWFSFSWLLEQLPKLNPTPNSELPAIDVFITAADPDKESPLVTANTALSVLAADYPVEKLTCYISDDAGSLQTFEAIAEVSSFAALWVPFCRKHDVEPRGPESYFNLKKDPYWNKIRPDFVKDRRKMKREYDEFKVRINALREAVRRRSYAYNALEERKVLPEAPPPATWMADACHWPATWINPLPGHRYDDHPPVVQVMLSSPSNESIPTGNKEDGRSVPSMDLTGVNMRLPLMVYIAREKRPGFEDHKKAGALNALARASAIISNGPFLLNLDYDNYVHDSLAFREGICYMLDGSERVCFVQYPLRLDGVDPSDRYANHNNALFDANMRALDGIQGPFNLGSRCLFRRMAVYGFDPPEASLQRTQQLNASDDGPSDQKIPSTYSKRFGNSTSLIDSIPVAEFQSRPVYDRPQETVADPRGPVTLPSVAEALSVISCSYEDKTQWGERVGWIYGSAKEDVATGYRMHNQGWRSVYCAPTERDFFRSAAAPINLADRLNQILRRATGSVEMFFSHRNPLLVSPNMRALQRLAYLNHSANPFTSVFLTVYCFLPAFCLLSGQFIVQSISATFLAYVLALTVTLCILTLLEIKWSDTQFVDWWRNEQMRVIGGTSAHLGALLQGPLRVLTGIEPSPTAKKSSASADDEEFAHLYAVRWTWLMVPPITIMALNLIAVAIGVSRTIQSSSPEWSEFLGGLFFSFWVMIHLHPFAKGLMGRRGKTPTVVFVWSGLVAITISLLWLTLKSPSGAQEIGGSITFP
ncbi:hypothetical protein ZIOFF_057783 [Zingiber officinale]|uniref:Uncharacterized protein n=1 Tax=Zingiber officinale TaxID=94328 RepID=A0A8J5KLB7_ZINOF|nr:hypothetical protein ZIOFF_057783 [Zingiber officinale]